MSEKHARFAEAYSAPTNVVEALLSVDDTKLATFDMTEIELRAVMDLSELADVYSAPHKPIFEDDLTDFVDGQLHTVEDPTEVIYGNGHDKVCDYKPLVTSYGTVFCLTCESTIATLDALATKCKCGCFSTVHKSDGKCLSCGRMCA